VSVLIDIVNSPFQLYASSASSGASDREYSTNFLDFCDFLPSYIYSFAFLHTPGHTPCSVRLTNPWHSRAFLYNQMARTTDSKNGKRPKKSRRSDGRKRWFKSHTNVAITTSDDFEERIKQIPSLNLEDLQTIVQEAAAEPNVHLQMQVLILCLRLILKKMHPSQGREPKIQQVRTLRRLIFGKGDTILIAATGFGKSLILHAFSILTAWGAVSCIPPTAASRSTSSSFILESNLPK
jgi:hypothetical protein